MEDRNRNDGSTLEATGLARTFKEVVREEHGEGKDVNWKSFKDGIRMHTAGHAWAAAVAESANARPRAALSRTQSSRGAPQRNSSSSGGADEQDEAVAALLQRRPPPAREQPKVKMSLMALLADTGGYSDGDEEDEEDDDAAGKVTTEKDEGGDNGGGGGKVRECCVCMVRHNGAEFIPCGHTFCRLCSRELSVSRGNCPLCSSFVLEILDVF